MCTERFTKKETKQCIKKRAFKSCKANVMQYWMVVHGGDRLINFLSAYMNELWDLEYMPEEFYETTISYICANRGSKYEIINYRLFALNWVVARIFTKLWLYRISKILLQQVKGIRRAIRKILLQT